MAEKDKSINKILLEVLKLLAIAAIIISSSALILLALIRLCIYYSLKNVCIAKARTKIPTTN